MYMKKKINIEGGIITKSSLPTCLAYFALPTPKPAGNRFSLCLSYNFIGQSSYFEEAGPKEDEAYMRRSQHQGGVTTNLNPVD